MEDLPQLNDNMNNYSQNQTELSNNTNNLSSINSSFLNPTKINIKNNNKINNIMYKHFYLWYQKTYNDIIKNRLRSLYLFLIISNKIKTKQQCKFMAKFKIYNYALIKRKIKKLFTKYYVGIIKACIIKCHLYKMFNRYKNIIFKRMIVRKLKEYMIRSRNKIYNEIEKDIKNFNKDINIVFNYPRKKLIKNSHNNNQSVFNIYQKNKNIMNQNTNKSMLNLIRPQPGNGIILTENDNNIELNYHYTEENQPFNSNEMNNILFFEQKNDDIKGKDIDIDMITKMNQLTMVINLIERRLIKNKKDSNKKALSLLYYFNRWKILSNNKTNSKTKIKTVGELTAPTDIEEVTQNTLNDFIQTESDLGTKCDHLPFTLSTNSNSKNSNNKYVPVRGVKFFQEKLKQKIYHKNKTYNINNLIGQYKTNTILTKNENNSKTYNKYDNEIVENHLIINDNFRTFNDYNCINYNNITNNDMNKYLKINNMILNTKINDFQKKQNINNTNNIYHRKTIGSSIKNNLNNNLNNISKINNYNIHNNFLCTNDSINTTMENYYNYSGNFLGVLNNNSYLEDYKVDPNILWNKKENYNKDYNRENIFGFKKVNKIEEREICFYPTNKSNNNINDDKNNGYNFNKYCEDINLVYEIKKYYKEDLDIYNIDVQKKKYNSFIINIFNNNIIMTQEAKTKRSKSK
jgi:hypothetical protein